MGQLGEMLGGHSISHAACRVGTAVLSPCRLPHHPLLFCRGFSGSVHSVGDCTELSDCCEQTYKIVQDLTHRRCCCILTALVPIVLEQPWTPQKGQVTQCCAGSLRDIKEAKPGHPWELPHLCWGQTEGKVRHVVVA